MGINRIGSIALLAGAALALAGCGGGSGGGAGGSGDPSVTSGTITAFGSIVVNGRHIEVDGSGVRVGQDGDGRSVGDLALGQAVRVEDGGVRRVEIEEAVRGPVDSIDPGAGRVVVMGQTVQTDAATILDDSPAFDLGSLSPGEVLEVHGLRGPGGVIQATRLELKTGADVTPYTATGRATNHDTGARTFEIGGLTVQYNGATIDDLPAGSWNGLLIEARDATGSYAPGTATLNATKVERENPAGGRVGDLVEIERAVTAPLSGGTFEVDGGLLVRAGGARFRLGTAADIVVGARVEIEGRILSDGSLQAREIKLDDNAARISGVVEQVDAAAGTLRVLGVSIGLAPGGVRFDDLSGLGELDADGSEFVEIRGRAGPNGAVIAHRIRLRDGDTDRDRELRGPVTAGDAGSGLLRILGVDALVGDRTEFEIEDRRLSRAAFFGRIVLDVTIVEVKWDGDPFGGTGTAPESAEIELQDD